MTGKNVRWGLAAHILSLEPNNLGAGSVLVMLKLGKVE